MTSFSAPDGSGASLQAYRWTVPACALAGLALALLLLGLRAPAYESISRVTVNNPIGTMQDEAVEARSPAIIAAAAASIGFEPDVSVEANEVARLLTITSRADSPEKAAAAANAVANTYVQAQTTAAVGVATPAEVNDGEVGAGALSYMLLGSLVGAIAGVILLGVFMVFRRRPRNRPPAAPPAVATRASDEQTSRPATAGAIRVPGSHQREPGDLRDEVVPSTAAPVAEPEVSGGDDLSAVAARRRLAERRSRGDSSASGFANAFAEAAAGVGAGQPGSGGERDRLRAADTDAGRPSAASSTPATSLEFDDLLDTRWSGGASSMDGLTQLRWSDDSAHTDADTDAPDPAEPATSPTPPSPSAGPSDVPAATASASDQSTFTAMTASTVEPADDPAGGSDSSSTSDEERYQLVVQHRLEVAELEARYEKTIADLRSEVSGLNRRLRSQGTQLTRIDGNDQHRVGDLEAQVVALDDELSGMRDQLERERIAHTRRLTEERGAADRALDDARREYREELAKHEQVHRASLSEQRADLDRTLADDRAKQALALEAQHRSYETALENEREHRAAELASVAERHQKELAEAREHSRLELGRQASQHKETITSLRDAAERSDAEIAELEKMIRGQRTEIATLQQQARSMQADHAAAKQKLVDQLAVSRAELASERERNAALRADVLRRSAEAHEVVDRALEERTAQLAELEAAVARQREYSDARVREVSSAAEERARQSALREADLSAKVSRLERELNQLRASLPTVDSGTSDQP